MKHGAAIHPLNAKGKYYIDQNHCTCSAACEFVAPQIFQFSPDHDLGYYVARQPQNDAEEELCREAMDCCPVEAIRDDGMPPTP